MLIINREFVQKWSKVYNERFKNGTSIRIENEIREWLCKQSGDKYLNKEYFVKLGRWKSARVTKHYERNDEETIVGTTIAAFREPDELSKINILLDLYGVGVRVASTILNYLHPETFPIFDYHCVKVLAEAGLWKRKTDDFSKQAWLDYVHIMRGLAERLGVHIRDLDKAMFAYEKRDIYLKGICS